MSTPSQGLRALASLMDAVAPQLSSTAQTALAGVTDQLHSAADAEAAAEASHLGGALAGPVLAAFATAMVDGFFAAIHLARPTTASVTPIG